MATSLTSSFALAVQAAKGTPATANFFSGRFLMSGGGPQYDVIETMYEHFRGAGSRPTTRKTISQRSSYIVPFAAQGNLYPLFLGAALRGIGFGVSSAGTDPEYTHTFTVAARDSMPWLSGIIGRGDGAGAWDRKFVDGRLETLQVQGGPRGLTLAVAGSALQEADALGTETFVNEAAELLVPSVGSATITIGGGAFTGPVRGLQWQISNQVDKNEQRLFNFERGDLQPLGLDCALQLMAIDVDADLYAEFHMNNATTDAPAPASIPGAIEFTFSSANDIPTGSNPYSLTVAIPSVEFRMGAVQSQRNQLIRTNLAALMIDDASAPITVTLVNSRATY
ncbi:MAG: hypothetical protein M9936_31900 [Caldilinea sp.]|nr:hypothetical protein [Caldilinea sp.]